MSWVVDVVWGEVTVAEEGVGVVGSKAFGLDIILLRRSSRGCVLICRGDDLDAVRIERSMVGRELIERED